ncbi:hypothetical protein CLV84_3731 [Neolewinella xylanilytica]|uniref:Outer membrane protein with beta-barrel domain n=1 Tax=Neolewinella xylanilytica TaxID=1514080 RepID=A0A2S6I0S1_9BACT|nr:hypothetical protein [Neolewinella xylanilytica]PPK84569.1 hypothetical protein CLV84_3731 [Neolewinella xylanilytica]
MKSHSYLLFFSFLCFSNWANGQSAESPAAVESVYGAQIGFFGVWGYTELPLGRSVVARLEAGLDAGYRRSNDMLTGAPVIAAGPRWYYNLDKRAAKEKRIAGNAANFLSLPIAYRPGWFTLSNGDDAYTDKEITLLPTWGIRRNLGKHLNFEVGVGIGYRVRWLDFGVKRFGDVAAWVPLRIGF